MVKRILSLLLLFILTFPGSVYAQEGLTLSSLEIDLWPEYDRPNMLVIYHATLPPEISLPVEVTFRIPADAGNPNAVAMRQLDGSLISTPFDRQVNGEWGLITFTATSPKIQLEYYDPSLEKEAEQRHYEYTWPGDYAVQNLTIQAQLPIGAEDVRFSPSINSNFTGQDGMVYYATEVGTLSAGETYTIAMEYAKSNDLLSGDQFEVQPSANLEVSGQTDWLSYLPWVLGLLGITLITAGGFWYWRQSKNEEAGPQQRRRRRAVPSEIGTPNTGEDVYCHNCGKRASSNDKFCRSCGTRLKT